MNEVEKMYRNSGIEKQYFENLHGDGYCYPEFTAEKQLEIFKIFCRRYLEVSQHVEENVDLCFGIKAIIGDFAVGFNKDFAECLADFVNCLWQDLTDAERKQIKEILE
jgi:hypothetical protein